MDGGGGGEGCDASLGAAAYGACYVGCGCGVASAGEDEAVDGGELRVEAVDGLLEACDVGVGDAGWEGEGSVGVAGEIAADVEEAVL